MSLMLPSHNSASLSLADVLPSCLASLGISGYENALSLPHVSTAVVVLVDGLGSQNLSHAKAHARFLAGAAGGQPKLQTVFPSTTASALATLTTGSVPGVHGMLGYKIRDPRSGQMLNMLKDLAKLEDMPTWLGAEPLYGLARAQDVTPTVVSHSRFASTPLTEVIHRGATMLSANSFDERVDAVIELSRGQGKNLVVVYFSELDELAHSHGVSSHQWAAKLEDLDAALERLQSHVSSDVGIIVTADHGVVDIPAHKQILFGSDSDLITGVREIGGEPRCLQLYVEPEADRDLLVVKWRDFVGDTAWVVSREDAVENGLLSGLSDINAPRVGDIFVLARKDVVFYDERDAARSGRNMVGQHGGLSPVEMAIPCIKLGGYR